MIPSPALWLLALAAHAVTPSQPTSSSGARRPALASNSDDAHRLVMALDDIAADYPEALDEAPIGWRKILSQIAWARELVQSLGPTGAFARPMLASIEDRMKAHRDRVEVVRDAQALAEEIAARQRLIRAPQRSPDLIHGAQVYTQNCAVCHGPDGRANSETARAMHPRPPSFFGMEPMEYLNAYRVHSVVKYGVRDTGMPAFELLDPASTWDVAFFVMSLRHACPTRSSKPLPLTVLAIRSDHQLRADFGNEALACIRHSPRTR